MPFNPNITPILSLTFQILGYNNSIDGGINTIKQLSHVMRSVVYGASDFSKISQFLKFIKG